MLESFLKLGIVVKRCFFPWSKLKKRKGLLITANLFTSKRHAMKLSQLYDEIHNLFKTGQTEAKKEEKLAHLLAVLSKGPF